MKNFIHLTFLVLSTFALFTGCSDSDAIDTKPEVTVTFDSQGGSTVAPITVEQGAKITRPADPIKGGFIFAGWFKEQTCLNAWDFQNNVVEANITLYAKWATEVSTVTFETNGGSTIEPVEVASGAALTKPTDPTKEGFTFENWYSDTALTTVYDFSIPVTANLTLYAKWTAAGSERDALRDLLDQTHTLKPADYTPESFEVLIAAQDVAEAVLENPSATSAEILAAYTALEEAFAGLVSSYDNVIVGLVVRCPYLIDGVVYVSANQWISVQAYAVNAAGEPVLDEYNGVTFEYDAEQLTRWGEVSATITDLRLVTKAGSLEVGTAELIISSITDPSISETVILQTAVEGQLRQIFLDLAAALPEPSAVNYDDLSAIQQVSNTYFLLSQEEQAEPAVAAAYAKVQACYAAYAELPNRLRFSAFTGDICTLSNIDPNRGESIVGKFTYTADGAFPAGTFIQNDTMVYYGQFLQYRYTIGADGTGKIEYRSVDNAAGDGATPWEMEQRIAEVTYDGSQAEGGMIYFKSVW